LAPPLRGRIMTVQGQFSSSGRILYRVYVPMDPEPLIFPVHEEEIEPVNPTDSKPAAASPLPAEGPSDRPDKRHGDA
jgi:hypothetical protein